MFRPSLTMRSIAAAQLPVSDLMAPAKKDALARNDVLAQLDAAQGDRHSSAADLQMGDEGSGAEALDNGWLSRNQDRAGGVLPNHSRSILQHSQIIAQFKKKWYMHHDPQNRVAESI